MAQFSDIIAVGVAQFVGKMQNINYSSLGEGYNGKYQNAPLKLFKFPAYNRNSLHKFGGPNTILFEVRPQFKRIDAEAPALYCNFRSRSSGANGLSYARFFTVDAELNALAALEVWACSGTVALKEAEKQALRQKRQAERHGVVSSIVLNQLNLIVTVINHR